MIRPGVYQIDLGKPRGHEQGGKRYGVVISPDDSGLSVVTVVPTSTSAQPSIMRPEVEIAGEVTRLLVDQTRSIDTRYVHDMVDVLSLEDYRTLREVLRHYLNLGE